MSYMLLHSGKNILYGEGNLNAFRNIKRCIYVNKKIMSETDR